MRVCFYETKDWEEDYLREKLKGHDLSFDKSLDAVHEDAEAISVFIYSEVTAEMIDRMPKLKLIITRSTGFDHIDLDHCRKLGIQVRNVPSYGENTVAEHTFALILSLSRNVHKSYLRTLRDDFSIDGLTGFDLKGKTLGVVGTGHIGLHVVKIARGFGMEVIAYDTKEHPFLSEVLGFRYAGLDELLKISDIISLHVPHNDHTHHLISKDNIGKIKQGAILINTSRGGLVETDALLEALQSGRIGGAGLDVIEGEELIKEEKELLHADSNIDKLRTVIKDKVILKRENVVFTPHNAFNSKEALQRILDTSVDNLLSFVDGREVNKLC